MVSTFGDDVQVIIGDDRWEDSDGFEINIWRFILFPACRLVDDFELEILIELKGE